MRKARLTEQQWKVLWIFTHFPERAAAAWVDATDHVIAPVEHPLVPPPEAVGIKVHRRGDDGRDLFKGEAADRTHLNAADALALQPFWAVPFRQLNGTGQAIGARDWAPPPKADVSVSFRVTWAKFKHLKERAGREGRTITALLHQATTEYLERCQ